MFARLATLALPVAALAAVAAAGPLEARGGTIPASQCNTGDLSCCNSTSSASDPTTSALLGLLGIVVGPVDALVGFTCTPISVIGLGGNSCTQQPVCCTNNNFNGLVNVGCNPVNLNA